jgi:hypothetical protein
LTTSCIDQGSEKLSTSERAVLEEKAKLEAAAAAADPLKKRGRAGKAK